MVKRDDVQILIDGLLPFDTTVDYVRTLETHEQMSLGLPYTRLLETKSVGDFEIPIMDKIQLPLSEVQRHIPQAPPPSSLPSSSSQPPSLSGASTESTSTGTGAQDKGQRLSADFGSEMKAPSMRRSLAAAKPYRCMHGCDTQFDRKAGWRRHEERHFPQEFWICHECSKQFTRLDKWREHQRSTHKLNPSPEEIKNVKKPVLENFPRNCRFCERKTSSWAEWIDHVGDHFAGKIPYDPWDVLNRKEAFVHVDHRIYEAPESPQAESRDIDRCTNEEYDPKFNNNFAVRPSLGGVHIRVVQSLFDGVNNLLQREHARQSQQTSTKSSSSKGVSTRTGRSSRSGGESGNKVQKRRQRTDESPDEDSEEERPNQQPLRRNTKGPYTTAIEFACPYYKANPEGIHPKKCDRGSWKTISKLKYEHLQRHHKIQASHIGDEVLAGICDKTNLTLEDKWGAIYLVIFPEATQISCPYYGIDWPPPIKDSIPPPEEPSSQTQRGPLHSGVPFTEEGLHSAVVELGFFPAVMTKIRTMLEEEERLRQERINARVPEIVTETYWSLISTLNPIPNEEQTQETLENGTDRHFMISNRPASAGPWNENGAGVSAAPDMSASMPTQEILGRCSNAVPLHETQPTSDPAEKALKSSSDPAPRDDRADYFDRTQTPYLGADDVYRQAPYPVPQACSNPTQHSQLIDPEANYCFLCKSLVFPLVSKI